MWRKPDSFAPLLFKGRVGHPRLVVRPKETHSNHQGETAPSKNLPGLSKALLPLLHLQKVLDNVGIMKPGVSVICSSYLCNLLGPTRNIFQQINPLTPTYLFHRTQHIEKHLQNLSPILITKVKIKHARDGWHRKIFLRETRAHGVPAWMRLGGKVRACCRKYDLHTSTGLLFRLRLQLRRSGIKTHSHF